MSLQSHESLGENATRATDTVCRNASTFFLQKPSERIIILLAERMLRRSTKGKHFMPASLHVYRTRNKLSSTLPSSFRTKRSMLDKHEGGTSRTEKKEQDLAITAMATATVLTCNLYRPSTTNRTNHRTLCGQVTGPVAADCTCPRGRTPARCSAAG